MIFNTLVLINVLILVTECQLNHPLCSTHVENSTVLNTLNGKIKGNCYNITTNFANKPKINTPILTWLSVPYAQPPTNNLRFKSPVPLQLWNETFNGLSLPKQCIQGAFSDQTYTSEDCLYLNIYSPYKSYMSSVVQNNNRSQLPIFVWIHGGAFIDGSSDLYDATTFASVSNIIVITINYRLGAFGFLYIKGTEARGNQALLDQNLALKWIYENAARFGGDQNKITIGGESAGSWSVGYHLLLKSSWPYFRNAILQSGNPTTLDLDTLLLTPNKAFSIALNIAANFSCDLTNATNVLSCLQSVNSNDFNQIANGFQTYPAFVLDKNVFDQPPRKLFESGNFKHCNILTGSNNFEELLLAPSEIGNDLISQLVYGNFSSLRTALKKRLQIDDIILNKIIFLYVPLIKINDKTINFYYYFIEIITDFQYKCPTYKFADFVMKYNMNAFVYSYAHRLSFSNQPPVNGAAHSEELAILFGYPLTDNSIATIEERMFSEQIIKYWGSFIANEKPTITKEWSKFSDYRLALTRNVFTLKSNLMANTVILPTFDLKCKFWNYFDLNQF